MFRIDPVSFQFSGLFLSIFGTGIFISELAVRLCGVRDWELVVWGQLFLVFLRHYKGLI
ncbi:hypothetical protein [Paenibacillus senegalimassiliensis]|uniref:hypothetical protein n=1 Tax=Paenibacillus senegalimassiliensis TaxID=1737426 RepID=UPI0016521045|nr:hypothetical protein [Paenibacillus senegalimassiliensis]